jgi:hypothetical protein
MARTRRRVEHCHRIAEKLQMTDDELLGVVKTGERAAWVDAQVGTLAPT